MLGIHDKRHLSVICHAVIFCVIQVARDRHKLKSAWSVVVAAVACSAGAVGESVVESVVTRKNIFSNVFAVRENVVFCLCFGHVEHL